MDGFAFGHLSRCCFEAMRVKKYGESMKLSVPWPRMRLVERWELSGADLDLCHETIYIYLQNPNPTKKQGSYENIGF